MRRLVFLVLTAAFTGLAGLAASAAPSAETGRFALHGTVTRVVDGDTLDVRLIGGRRERIRLIGIDTPELRPAGCFASEAAARARELAQGKRVRLFGDATQATRDRYGRLLAYVVLPDRSDLGRRLISEGFGYVYVYARPFQRLPTYRAAGQLAEVRGRGLWSACATGTPLPLPLPLPLPPPPPPPPSVGNCAASYPGVCIPPPPPDLDCAEIAHVRFQVRHDVPDADPHRFDGDRDGIGCEA